MNEEVKLSLILLGVGGWGGTIFGYTTGVIAGALPLMEDEFSNLADSSLYQGVVSAAILVGAVIGSAFGSVIASFLNMKRTVFISGLIVVIGSLCSGLMPYLILIILSRGFLGVGVGIISVVCPLYVSEMAPTKYSGALGSWFQVALTFGVLLAYISNISLESVAYNYRWMFGAGAIPGVFLSLMFFIMPPARSDIPNEMLGDEKIGDKPSGLVVYAEAFRNHPRLIALSVVLAGTLQLTGINAILYYAPTIFENAGFTGNSTALLASVGVGVWNFLTTFVAIFLVDRVGRRPLLLSGLSMMAVSVIILGFVFQFLTANYQTWSGILSIIFLFLFIFGFEAGIGSLFWPLLTETFPEEYRNVGASIGNVLQWTFNIILTFLFPVLIEQLSQGIVFWGFGIMALLCFVFLFFQLPETKKVDVTLNGE